MKPLLIILGPTASGKTNLATQVCALANGEIISADSRQVYRGMDIGTGKDLHEYVVDGHPIPYHLIDILDAGAQYNVNEFQKDFKEAYEDIDSRSKTTVVCGGTGFYLHALLSGHAFSAIPVDESLREELENLTLEELQARFGGYRTTYSYLADISTRKRLIRAIEISIYLTVNPVVNEELAKEKSEYNAVIYGLNPSVELRRQRISNRLEARLDNGLIAEVETLLTTGLLPEQLIYYGLEYKFVTLYLTGQMTYHEMAVRLETEIHRFAKRQMTFFRKMEKDGFHINWLDSGLNAGSQAQFVVQDYEEAIRHIS